MGLEYTEMTVCSAKGCWVSVYDNKAIVNID